MPARKIGKGGRYINDLKHLIINSVRPDRPLRNVVEAFTVKSIGFTTFFITDRGGVYCSRIKGPTRYAPGRFPFTTEVMTELSDRGIIDAGAYFDHVRQTSREETKKDGSRDYHRLVELVDRYGVSDNQKIGTLRTIIHNASTRGILARKG